MDYEPFDLSALPEPQPLYTHPTWFYVVLAGCAIVATSRYVFG